MTAPLSRSARPWLAATLLATAAGALAPSGGAEPLPPPHPQPAPALSKVAATSSMVLFVDVDDEDDDGVVDGL
jgi:hypothetical protein